MFHPRPCGCKGQRTCLVCEQVMGEQEAAAPASWVTQRERECASVYCPECDLVWPGWDANSWKSHPDHKGEGIRFPGVKIIRDFISEEEERQLMKSIDEVPWDLSQSGRRKQNYGPKCNFKKRRVRSETFLGYPAFTKYLQERFASVDVLEGFQTVEQCSLEYSPERGASIDPHIDDCWIWGERIPTLSLLIDSTLTLRRFSGPETKYNLEDRKRYPSQVGANGSAKGDEEMRRDFAKLNEQTTSDLKSGNGHIEHGKTSLKEGHPEPTIIRIPMPRRSLLVLYGPPRYNWEHGILREDIPSRRVCITYRELTPTYLPYGPKADTGEHILQAGKQFWDHRQHYSLDHVVANET